MPERKAALADCATPPGGKMREIRVAAYCIAWGLSFVGASFVIKRELVSGPVAWLIAALPSIAAVALMVAYTRYLRQMDELDRLIQLQAMAWAFGGGFFAICGYMLFQRLGAPEVDGTTLTAIMPVLFAIGTLVGRWRYR